MESGWHKQEAERSNTSRVLGDLIERAEAVLDFYYVAQIEGTKRETKIKFDLEDAISQARRSWSLEL